VTPPTLHLKVASGNAAGTEIVVEDELLIGRQAEGAGSLGNDVELSRRHARIFATESGFAVEDLGSTNGTFVNGRIIQEPEAVQAGDAIEVGGSRLVVQVSGVFDLPPEEPAAEPDADEEPAAAPERAATPPIGFRVEIDPETGEGLLQLDDGDSVRLVVEDDRWRFAAPG
jgi:pSer/pThr/pTyr-binding forkhead associated (FHA) protein